MTQYDVISFLSDLGTDDESVGVCKAIMMQQAPNATIIDITHQINPFDVRAGALALTRAIQFLPTGVVLAAIDPGAPKDQRYIAVELENSIFVGPDNGILAPAAQLLGEPKRVHEITNPEYRIEAPGGVFAARDIMAPAAGVIASGVDISELGNAIPLEQLVPGMLQLSRHDEGGAFLGEVWSIDRFSNVQTNITPEEMTSEGLRIGDSVIVRVGQNDFMVKFVERYADLAKSQLGLIVDSTGMLSVVKNLDFAATELGVSEGAALAIMPQGATITGRDVTVEKIQASTPLASPQEQVVAPAPAAPMDAPVAQTPLAYTPVVQSPVDPTPLVQTPASQVTPQAPAPFVPAAGQAPMATPTPQVVGAPIPASAPVPQAPVPQAPVDPAPVAQAPVATPAIFDAPQPAQSFVKEPTLMPLPSETFQEAPVVPQTPAPVPAPVQESPMMTPSFEPSPSDIIANPAFGQVNEIPSVAQPVYPVTPEPAPQVFDTPVPVVDPQINSGSVAPTPAVPQAPAPFAPSTPVQNDQVQTPMYPQAAPAPAAPVDQIPSGNVFDLFKIDDDSETTNGNEDPFSPAQ